MTTFYTNINGNQWSGFDYSVDYICEKCNNKVERAQIQWEDLKIHQKFNICRFCGMKVPQNFPIYTNKGWIYND